MSTAERRPMVISPLWFQGVVLTFLFGFAILSYLAIRVYQDQAPIPGRVVSEKGQVILTREDILDGQEAFLTYGLMQYGSIYGHGAYLGPDFTADYLHRQALKMQQLQGGDGKAEEKVRQQLQANRYDPKTDTLTWTDEQIQAFDWLWERYREEFLNRERSGAGLGPRAIPDPSEARQITAFIAWTAWTAAARRPGQTYSYTNNWPPEPLVGNHLTQEAVIWSTLSIITLLGGIGAMLGIFGRYCAPPGLAWHGGAPPALPAAGRGGADAGPALDGVVLLRGRRAVPGAEPPGRSQCPLPCGRWQLLRHRPGASVALQPDPYLARAARHLRGGHRLPGCRYLPRSPGGRP